MNRDLFPGTAHLQRRVHYGSACDVQFHPLAHEFLEIWLLDPDLVNTGRQIKHHILALLICRHGADFARIRVSDRNRGVRHHGPRLIGDYTAQGPGVFLRPGSKRNAKQQRQHKHIDQRAIRVLRLLKMNLHGFTLKDTLSRNKMKRGPLPLLPMETW